MDIVEASSWLQERQGDMLSLAKKLSNINSGSYNIEGIIKTYDLVESSFAKLDCNSEKIQLEPQKKLDDIGNFSTLKPVSLHRYWKRDTAPVRVLLVGHVDTVFDKDSSFNRAEISAKDPNILNGPGVTDMKGGIVVILNALLAFEKLQDRDNVGWEVILNPDEEIGSSTSSAYLEQRAKHNHVGLVYEPALDDSGTFAGNRGGSGKFYFTIHGKASHVGRAFSDGNSAIIAAAKLNLALHNLNKEIPEAIINVGKVTGGGPVNVVPDFCMSQVGIRINDNKTIELVNAKMHDIVKSVEKDTEVTIKIEGAFNRPPKPLLESTQKMFSLLDEVAANLGSKVKLKDTKGCCDGNNLQIAGLPTIDTMGVLGGAIHSTDEYLLIPSLVERAQLTLHFLHKLCDLNLPLDTK